MTKELIEALEALKYTDDYDKIGDSKVRIHVNVALDNAINLVKQHTQEQLTDKQGEPPCIVLNPAASDLEILHCFRSGFNIVISRKLRAS